LGDVTNNSSAALASATITNGRHSRVKTAARIERIHDDMVTPSEDVPLPLAEDCGRQLTVV